MKAKGIVIELIESFVSLIYPNVCINCSKVLFNYEKGICSICLANLPRCSSNMILEKELKNKFIFEPKIDNVKSFLIYRPKGIGQKLIHALKYKDNQQFGHILGSMFAEELSKANFHEKYDLVIPIPLHKNKLRTRGYNQSECIANPIAEKLKLPHAPHGLIRTVFTKTQTRKDKVHRWSGLNNPFVVNDEYDLNERRILLVDDVITTGATISAAVEALILAGVTSVGVVSLAMPKK
ncbi:MAG: ComF family protein [Cyclobacteriaceae bacterium]